MGKKLKLFEDEGADDDIERISKVEIDENYAKRFEHNKKREDLQRLQELEKKGIVSDSDGKSTSSMSSDEDEDEIPSPMRKKKDLKFFDALIKVRNHDPVLKDKESKLFHSESEDEEDSDNQENEEGESKEKKKNKKNPMYLKDVMSRLLIEEGPDFEGDGDDHEETEVEKKKVKSYSEEQEEFRKNVLRGIQEAERKSNEESEDGGEFLKVKEKLERNDDDEDGVILDEKLDEFFGKDEKLDENEMFLKDFFRKRLWEGDAKDEVREDEEDFGFSDEEEEIEKQDDYEREYNFRFEESTGDRVLGHSRTVDGLVRKKTNTRKLQRERKEERMAQAELERKEELKRLKNLKKKEINEKLQKIRVTAGIGEEGICPLDVDDLEKDFDPAEHDRKMTEAYGDNYYDAEDVDPEFGSDKDEDDDGKPDFDKEDELLGLAKGWDDANESGDGFISMRARLLRKKAENGEDSEEEDEEEGKRKRKKKKLSSEDEKAVREELMGEYYKLDYEDTIGDLKTRFKYQPVKAKKFGLRTEEILIMDDKELNQYVSLKKLAPYREKEWKVPHAKVQEQKEKNKPLLRGDKRSSVTEKLLDKKKKKNETRDVDKTISVEGSATAAAAAAAGDVTSKLSRGSKRRRNKAEFKLSQGRLSAYGKIPSKSKAKK